jgi:hypothetical protein
MTFRFGQAPLAEPSCSRLRGLVGTTLHGWAAAGRLAAFYRESAMPTRHHISLYCYEGGNSGKRPATEYDANAQE